MAEEKNGFVKWYQLLTVSASVLGVTVTISLFAANSIIANDRMRESEDKRIESRMDNVKDCMHSIDKRLSRIEAKMGIPNGVPYANLP